MRRWLTLGLVTGVIAMSAACLEEDASPAADARPAASAKASGLPEIHLATAFPALTFTRPVQLVEPGDGSNRLFVVEQPGRIRAFENRTNVEASPVFLDLRDRVYMGHNEEGLLSLVFHPRFKENRQFFVYYSANNPRRTVLSRFAVSADDPSKALPDSEKIILEVDQPWGNHKGSTILFGPDGFMYVSYGDGGAANDPYGHGQNLGTLLAKIIRIDVDREEGGRAYAIPKDNPFVNRPGARGEIWAYGLRNIWRMSFDRATGELWGGDVGQNKWEEIDLIVKGGNYGWNIREGFHPFKDAESEPPDPLLDPVIEYGRQDGISVTGGNVYRGRTIPDLVGAYLYADYASGRIWALRHSGGKMTASKLIAHDPRKYITSFGEDAAGELYVCCFDRPDGRGSSDGRIYRIAAQ